MDRFIARENIRHFVDRLETEPDQPTRATLLKLLIAEVDKYAKLPDRVDVLDENVSRIRNKIARFRAGGLSAAQDRQRVENLEELQEILVSKRHAVAHVIAQSTGRSRGASH